MELDSLDDLLTAWRDTRSPRLADAIEALAPPDKKWESIAKKAGTQARAAIGRLAKTVDDPRLATLYVTWLGRGLWPAPTAKELWTRAFAHLAKLDDSRQIPKLRAIAKALPPFVGAAHRAWVTESIEATAAAIHPAKADSKALAKALAGVKPPPAKPKKQAADLSAIWARPEDRDLRMVVADALMEREDPRGEFIAIQLRASSKERKRAAELEKKHGAEWLGAIGKLVTRGMWRYVDGFAHAIDVDRRGVKRDEYEAALTAPEWATIHTMHFSILTTPMWWLTAWMTSPATRFVRAVEDGSIKYKDAGFSLRREVAGGPWRLARVKRGYTRTMLRFFEALIAGLDAKARAQITIDKDVDGREQYVAALGAGRTR